MTIGSKPGLSITSNPGYAPGSAPAFDGGGFLPSGVEGLNLWLDAADSSTITESGGAVSQVDDKSGKGNNVTQGTGANQPTTNATTINGKNVIDFDANDFLSVADNATLDFDSGTGFSIFLVVNATGYSDQGSTLNAYISKGAASLVTNTYNIQTNVGNKAIFQSGNNEIIQNESTTINGATHIISAVMDNSDTKAFVYVETPRDINAAATVGSDNANALIIGGDTGAVRYAAGQYGEVLIYDRNLSDEEILSIQQYLSSKWGVTL